MKRAVTDAGGEGVLLMMAMVCCKTSNRAVPFMGGQIPLTGSAGGSGVVHPSLQPP